MTSDPNALLMMAAHSHAAGDFAAVTTLCDHILTLSPFNPDALMIKGLAARRSNQPAAAAALLRAALVTKPDHVGAWANLADLTDCDGQSEAAITAYRRVSALDRGNERALACLARLHATRWNLDAATAASRVLSVLVPDRADLHASLGELASVAGRHSQACAYLRRAVRLNLQDPKPYRNLGLALMSAKEQGASLPLRLALALQPDFAEGWKALADLLTRTGDLALAHEGYRRVVFLKPDDTDLRKGWAISALRVGEFETFWTWWEIARPHRTTLPDHILEIPVWNGHEDPGRLLVVGEQGIGDEILFSSCLPDAIGRVRSVVIACNPRLLRLFTRSFPEATVVPDTAAAIDAHRRIGIASLPRHFRKTRDGFPGRPAFLTADPAATAGWRSLFTAHGGRPIGVSWHTVTSDKRSIPLPDLIDALAPTEADGMVLVSLQYGDHAEALTAAAAHADVAIVRDLDISTGSDMDVLAAQVAACDLVVTIDNTTAHVAGALGIETWILIPAEAESRWEFDRMHSPWYPSVRLFRQPPQGGWSSVLVEIGDAFGLWRTRRTPEPTPRA